MFGLVERTDSRVDDPDHASLTVLTLRAVKPKRLCVVDLNRVDRHLSTRGYRHEARKETGNAGLDVVDWLTGLIEGRLHNRVILHPY